MSKTDANSNKPNDGSIPQTSQDQAEVGGIPQHETPAKEQFQNPAQETIVAGNAISQENSKAPEPASRSSGHSTLTLPIDNPQSLPSVVVGVEEEPDVKEPSLPIIGFNLSSFVLFIISGFILFLTIYLFAKDFDASSLINIPAEANLSDSTYERKIELIRMIQEEKKSYREFTVQMSQMVLLNLLLPVLTAILGYIFASNKNNNTNT